MNSHITEELAVELRASLLDTMSALPMRRASDIPAQRIEDYVERRWLEWHGGALRLTAHGRQEYERAHTAALPVEA